MRRFPFIALSLALFLTFTVIAMTGRAQEEKTKKTSVQLPEKFAKLLQEEMRQIEGGMKELITLISQGNTAQAAGIADKIHNSFILKQSLNKAELKELVSYLPGEFVQLDRTFHGNAKKLAEALRRTDIEKSGEIYGEMFNGCLSCHSRFAADKFPGLMDKTN